MFSCPRNVICIFRADHVIGTIQCQSYWLHQCNTILSNVVKFCKIKCFQYIQVSAVADLPRDARPITRRLSVGLGPRPVCSAVSRTQATRDKHSMVVVPIDLSTEHSRVTGCPEERILSPAFWTKNPAGSTLIFGVTRISL